jgi:NTP pyrophosphatase (non-canonical NTP hydrolase)
MQVLENKVRDWHMNRGLLDTDAWAQFAALVEEVGELSTAMKHQDAEGIADAIGDMMVVAINIAMRHNLTLELCLQTAYNEIRDRSGRVVDGRYIKEIDDARTKS